MTRTGTVLNVARTSLPDGGGPAYAVTTDHKPAQVERELQRREGEKGE